MGVRGAASAAAVVAAVAGRLRGVLARDLLDIGSKEMTLGFGIRTGAMSIDSVR